jgi:CBS domain-containing protein
MQVKDIMSSDIKTIGRNDDLLTAEHLMATQHCRHLPVVEDEAVVGLVTQRDLFKAAMPSAMRYGEKAEQAFLRSVRVKEIMVYPVITIAPTAPVGDAIDLILERGIGCLPVVNNGKLVGIVTKTDLLRHLRTISA